MGFYHIWLKAVFKKKKYSIIGYKGKQVRDNIHSNDLVNCFWEFYRKKTKNKGEAYNIGGGRKSNCSILEAIEYVENKTNVKVKKIFLKDNRIGDHKWYISDNSKFKKEYPKWRQNYDYKKILDEIVNHLKKKNNHF